MIGPNYSYKQILKKQLQTWLSYGGFFPPSFFLFCRFFSCFLLHLPRTRVFQVATPETDYVWMGALQALINPASYLVTASGERARSLRIQELH